MNLDEAQRKAVADWIAQGLKLADIQNRLIAEFGLTMTYMEVRLLVNELKLMPKDPEPTKPIDPVLKAPAKADQPATLQPNLAEPEPDEPSAPSSSVAVAVDKLARPGALVSGSVTFSDGQKAAWQLDQSGRLGLIPEKPGYRPPPTDVQQFQMALENELSKIGF